MPAATLSLGQASYTLLDSLTPAAAQGVSAVKRGTGATTNIDIRSTSATDTIYDLGIGVQQNINSPGNLNIFNNTSGLIANLSGGADNFNLFASSDNATINTAAGNDLINSQRNLTNSTVDTGAGNDTIRVAGSADNTNFFLGDGIDSLSINGASSNVYVNGGAGNDVIQFRGLITDGFVSNDGLNNTIIDAGDGFDTVQFFNGVTGSTYSSPASVNLGAGNDSLFIGGNGSYSNINVNAGADNDAITLQGSFIDSTFNLGTGSNNLSLTSGVFNNTSIQSQSTTGDTLVFAPGTSIFNDINSSGISLGSGGDSLVFGGVINSLINTGGGADTIIFGAGSTGLYNTELNLGNDNFADKVYFNMTGANASNSFSNLKISGQDASDTLYIGYGSYTAYNWDADNNLWSSSTNPSDTVRFAG